MERNNYAQAGDRVLVHQPHIRRFAWVVEVSSWTTCVVRFDDGHVEFVFPDEVEPLSAVDALAQLGEA